jgi:predicted aspartyl protease
VSLFKVQVQLNNQTVTALIDSGAACSLISSELASDLNLVIDSNQTKLKVVGQNDFNSTGSAQCQITIHGIKMVEISLAFFLQIMF